MLNRKTVLSMLAISLIGLLLASPSHSQQEQRAQRGQRGGQQRQRGQGQGQQGRGGQRSETRQSDTERMQERLGATDQEWQVLGPRVMRVSELSRQLRGGGRGRQRGDSQGGRGGQRGDSQGGRGGQRGDSQGGRGRQRDGSQDARPDSRQNTPAREPSVLEKAQEQLRTVLNNTSATPDQINKQLAALRTAKAKVTQQLVAAQTDLRKVITVRQEAQLVMMGMLD